MAEETSATEQDLDALLYYLREARGFDFTGYKRASLTRRVRRRMQDVGITDFTTYQQLLEAQPDEFTELFNTILINVTAFLRDRPTWDYVAESVIPRILENRDDAEPIRVWSAGCASGEEAYSLAVLLCDALGEDRFRQVVKVYGTDADSDALTEARHARYPAKALNDAFSEDQIARYFDRDDDAFVFRPDLRRAVIFGRHDLVRDPPISRVDLMVCRNTLMYFNADTQRSILSSFHFALNEGGFLFLGKSEALVMRTNLFVVDHLSHHVFLKERADIGAALATGPGPREKRRRPDPNLAASAFDHGPQAQLVINRDGILVLANRRARALFGLGLNHLGRPFRDLQVSYRPIDLRSRVERLFEDRRPASIPDVEYELPTGGTEHLEILVQPLIAENALVGAHVTFSEVGHYRQLQEELESSQSELESAYEELQSTVEELETTNEELQSTNEELETTNEELHSTNEELETMNEELQSTNEELATINDTLRERSAELDELSSFLQSILSSLQWGVAVLGTDMAVQVWNSETEELWGVRSEEVHGRHFLNLDIGLPVGELHGAIRACLSGQSSREDREVEAVNRRGRHIRCAVTIYPLRGSKIAGAIVLMESHQSDEDQVS